MAAPDWRTQYAAEAAAAGAPAQFYINAPADAFPAAAPADAGAAYDAVMRPETVVAVALADPAVQAAARAKFGADARPALLATAAEAVRQLRPYALKALGAFDAAQNAFFGGVRLGANVSFPVLKVVLGIAVEVVAIAARLTSPLTSRLVAYAIKAASLSDPACKTDVRLVGDATVDEVVRFVLETPLYTYRYRDGAAAPDDGLRHIGFMADAAARAGVGDGHAVPLGDMVAALMLAMRAQGADVAALRRRVAALERK